MCEVCRMIPCHPSCPNAPEQKLIYSCSKCGYGIFKGDKYLDGPEGYICERCLDDMSSKEILDMLDKSLKTA